MRRFDLWADFRWEVKESKKKRERERETKKKLYVYKGPYFNSNFAINNS